MSTKSPPQLSHNDDGDAGAISSGTSSRRHPARLRVQESKAPANKGMQPTAANDAPRLMPGPFGRVVPKMDDRSVMTDHEKIQEMVRLKDQAPIAIEPARTALLIIDVQRYFARPDYPFAQVIGKLMPGATDGYFNRVRSRVLPNIEQLQHYFRSHHLPVVFCGAGSYLLDGQDLPEWLRGFDELGIQLLGCRVTPPVGTPSWQFEDRVAPLPGELVLNKTSSGPLASTKLDQILHNMGINSLVVCGLTTAVCVTQTARETADRGFRVIVVEDACTEMSEEMHRAALFAFSYVFGRVRTTADVVKLLANAIAEPQHARDARKDARA